MACAAPELRVALQAEYDKNVVQEARIAQLEDELAAQREETQAAYEGQKPPVTVISDSPTTNLTTAGGAVSGLALEAPKTETAVLAQAESRTTGYTVAAIVAGMVGMFLIVVKLFGKRR